MLDDSYIIIDRRPRIHDRGIPGGPVVQPHGDHGGRAIGGKHQAHRRGADNVERSFERLAGEGVGVFLRSVSLFLVSGSTGLSPLAAGIGV